MESPTPVDDYRGGVAAVILDQSGARVANLQIYCHPDFPGFEICSTLSVETMLERAAARLQKTGHDDILLGESSGASVGMFLNPPDGPLPNTSLERMREK